MVLYLKFGSAMGLYLPISSALFSLGINDLSYKQLGNIHPFQRTARQRFVYQVGLYPNMIKDTINPVNFSGKD